MYLLTEGEAIPNSFPAKMMRTTTKEPAPEPSKSGSFVISNRPAADAHYETEPSRYIAVRI